MFSVKNEKNLKSSDKFGMRFEGCFVQSVKHVEEVFNVSKVFRWHVVLSSDSMSVSVGGYSWNFSQKSVDLLVSDFPIFVDSFSSQGRVLLRMKC